MILLARRGSVYESIYQDMDRDVGLEIAEKSHKDAPRVRAMVGSMVS